jgi:hypothetical protein
VTVDNIFRERGKIVRGRQFIGRRRELDVIRHHVFTDKPGNLAVMGMRKVGKSSLAYQALMSQATGKAGTLVIWLNVSTHTSRTQFFRLLVLATTEELRKARGLTRQLERVAKTAEESDHWADLCTYIPRFFAAVRGSSHRVVIVLDEFDSASALLDGFEQGFQFLEDLATSPALGLCLVTTSSRPLADIIKKARVSSVGFAGSFVPLYLPPFSDDDMEDFYGRLEKYGLGVDSAFREEVETVCGTHPFLLAITGHKLVDEQLALSPFDAAEAFRTVVPSVTQYYDTELLEQLRWDGSDSKLLQLLFGPPPDLTDPKVQRLVWYGLAKPDGSQYKAFSPHFHSYLSVLPGRP